MNRKVIIILAVLLQLLVGGCGGVIGHIEYYEFNISKYELEDVIKTVMKEYPELKVPKGGKHTYQDDTFSWSCFIKDDKGEEIFSYSFCGDSVDCQNEHERLKRMYAELSMEHNALKDLLSKKL